MNYHLKSKPKHEHRTKIIILVFVFVILSVFTLFASGIFRTIFYTISRPIWLTSSVVTRPFVTLKNYFVSKNNLINKNITLEDELSAIKLKEADYDLILKENEDLKNQLGRSDQKNRVLSRVLSKPPRSPYDTLVIDIGSGEGVTLGNKVYLSGNVILGVVTSVTPHTSLVQLFSSGSEKQEAVLSRTGAFFELLGKGGGNFHLEVPKDTDILWGDVFEYPGLSSSIIGSVYYIDSNSQSSFKTVYLRIPANVFSSKWVYIEKNQ